MNEKPDFYLSCVVVHRNTSSSHHEFLQAKLEKCSDLYESYFNPVSSPESAFRGTCHWIFKNLGWIPQPEFKNTLFPYFLRTAVSSLNFQKLLITKILRKFIVGVNQVSQLNSFFSPAPLRSLRIWTLGS